MVEEWETTVYIIVKKYMRNFVVRPVEIFKLRFPRGNGGESWNNQENVLFAAGTILPGLFFRKDVKNHQRQKGRKMPILRCYVYHWFVEIKRVTNRQKTHHELSCVVQRHVIKGFSFCANTYTMFHWLSPHTRTKYCSNSKYKN